MLVDDSESVRGLGSRASASTGLIGKRCYPAFEAQGVPQGHESGSFCRSRSIVQLGARAKSFFPSRRVSACSELARGILLHR